MWLSGLKCTRPWICCCQRHTGPLGLYHQQYRQVQRIGQFPGTGAGGQALPIVKTHGPLAHHSPVPGSIMGIKWPAPYPFWQKDTDPDCGSPPPAELSGGTWGRCSPARFERTGVGPALFQRRQHCTGNGGLAAAGRRRGDEELHHLCVPVIRKNGVVGDQQVQSARRFCTADGNLGYL